jgi:hypothetical protein
MPHGELYWREGQNELPGLICRAADFVQASVHADMLLYVGLPDHRSRSAAYLLYSTGRVVPIGRLIDVEKRATDCAPRSWFSNGRFFIAINTPDRPTCFANERGGPAVLDAMNNGQPTQITMVG